MCNAKISIHATRRGRDYHLAGVTDQETEISIHATRRGRDGDEVEAALKAYIFQFTRPAGAAIHLIVTTSVFVNFNSRDPQGPRLGSKAHFHG